MPTATISKAVTREHAADALREDLREFGISEARFYV
jgi:hypothetical protein